MISYLITFLVGAFTGAAGKYLADKYTDKRRANEQHSDLHKSFINLAAQMPELINEIQEDLSNPEYSVIREIIILPNDLLAINIRGNYLSYSEDKHVNLMHKVKLLENKGFVCDVTNSNVPKYRMTEDFVRCINNSKFHNEKISIKF